MSNNSNQLFMKSPHPYYIVCAPFTRLSAGIKLLHMLCHALNRKGQLAYVLLVPDLQGSKLSVSSDLLTPRLTRAIANEHQKAGKVPVIVYPETIPGNPLNGSCIVRYVLNFPGLLGGDKEYAASETVIAFSQELAEAVQKVDQILFLPISDTDVYHPRKDRETPRSGSCYYAMKYRKFFPGPFTPPEPDSIEITHVQTPQELAEIYRKVEKFYAYESTATSLDALLCGCPVVFIPNEQLTKPIGIESLTADGCAWGTAREEFDRAKATVSRVRENYEKAMDLFEIELTHFIERSQENAKNSSLQDLNLPFQRIPRFMTFFLNTWAFIRAMHWRGDWKTSFRNMRKVIQRRGIKAALREKLL